MKSICFSLALWAALSTGAVAADAPQLSISDVIVQEGNEGTRSAVFRVELVGTVTDVVTVDWATANLTATAGQDYDASTGNLTFFPEGRPDATITVSIRGDAQPEAAEGFFVHLTNALNATIKKGTGHGAITDDDGFPTAVTKGDLDGSGRAALLVGFEKTPMDAPEPPDWHIDTHQPWGTTVTVAQPLREVPSWPWHVVATNDFDGDGICDLIWATLRTDGEPGLRVAVTLTPRGWSLHAPNGEPDVAEVGSGWTVLGSGRFGGPGDPSADLLWWHEPTRTLEVWESAMVDGSVVFPPPLRRAFPGEPEPAWKPAVVTDTNSDGSPDLLWQHESTYQAKRWRRAWVAQDEDVAVEESPFGFSMPLYWRLTASGDFDGDGTEDLLLQREDTLKLVVWFMANDARVTGSFVSPDRFGPPAAAESGAEWLVLGPR